MTGLEASLLMFVGLLLGAVAAMVAVVKRRARWQRCRYRVFELRDQMVRLVAEGHVRPDEVVYDHTVRVMNSLIRHMPSFTAREVAKGMLITDEADHQRLSLGEYVAAIEGARPEVTDTVNTFWQLVARTLYENSVSLRAYVWLRRRYTRAADLLGRVTRRAGRPPSWRAYRVSQRHARAAEAVPA